MSFQLCDTHRKMCQETIQANHVVADIEVITRTIFTFTISLLIFKR